MTLPPKNSTPQKGASTKAKLKDKTEPSIFAPLFKEGTFDVFDPQVTDVPIIEYELELNENNRFAILVDGSIKVDKRIGLYVGLTVSFYRTVSADDRSYALSEEELNPSICQKMASSKHPLQTLFELRPSFLKKWAKIDPEFQEALDRQLAVWEAKELGRISKKSLLQQDSFADADPKNKRSSKKVKSI